MNRNEFMNALDVELRKNGVKDREEILADFAEHFARRLDEGFAEDEIARKIGAPEAIAKEYADQPSERASRGGFGRIVGLLSADFGVALLFVLLASSVLVLFAFTLACFALGILLVGSLNVAGLIPSMPYGPALLFGVACLALGVVAAIGTRSTGQYVAQWGRAYRRWRKNVLHGHIYPPLGMHPLVSRRTASILRFVNAIAVVVSVFAFAIGYLVSSLSAGSFEFWHVWHWFV